MISRDVCEDVFRAAVAACDPAARVRAVAPRLVPLGRAVFGIAVGKAALAMARGFGPVVRGIAVAPQLDGQPLPLGWTARDAGHPWPDERSVAAGAAVLDVVQEAGPADAVVALISGGASALIEQPTVPLAELRARIEAAMASGMPIHELNALRTTMSRLKGGKLARASRAPVLTLALSDVIGDHVSVIGSGPTVAPERQTRERPPEERDHALGIAPMRSFAEAARDALAARGFRLPLNSTPITGLVEQVAPSIRRGIYWGEPTLTVPPDHGEGGRMQQLALELAAQLNDTELCAFCVGSDGIDGPPPAQRPPPAGAFVDGTTWDRIAAAGIDPIAALERRDAGTALAAVGALVVTGPTGINHADLLIVG